MKGAGEKDRRLQEGRVRRGSSAKVWHEKGRVQKGSQNGPAVNRNAFYIMTSGREEGDGRFPGSAG